MKRSLTLLVALLFITATTFAQDTVKGGFKSCTVYEYKSKFGEIDKSTKLKVKTYSYDTKGSLLEEIHFNSDNYIKYKHIKMSDEKGNLIREIHFDSEGRKDYQNMFKYDEKNNKIEFSQYTYEGNLEYKTLYKYNDKDFIISETKFHSSGSLEHKKIYKYDEKGNYIERSEYDSEGNLESKFLFKYDDKNKIIEEATSNKGGRIIGNRIILYNEFGKIIEVKELEVNEEDSYVKKFNLRNKFEYDEKGQKILENEYSSFFGTSYIVKSTSYNYTSNEKLKEQITIEYLNNSGEINIKSIIKFDDRSNIVEKITYRFSLTPNIEEKLTFKYNEKGLLIEETKEDPQTPTFEKHSYKYDSFGNKIEKTSYNKLDEPISLVEYLYSK